MKRLMSIAALWLGCSATVASGAAPAGVPCLSEREAQSLVQVVLPDMLEGLGKACASALSPNATLRAGLPALLARYRVDSDAAWSSGSLAITKLGGEQLRGIDPEMVRPMMRTLLSPMVAKAIKQGDCPRLDRITALLAPLPTANTAALIVQLSQVVRDKKSNDALPLTICPDHG